MAGTPADRVPQDTDLRFEQTGRFAALCSRPLLQSAWIVASAALGMLLLGYHPYAEDGGIYAAAIAARQHPSLFPHDRLWVTAHTRFAFFVPLTAALSRALHLPIAAATLFTLQAAGLIALLAAAAHLARTCLPNQQCPWLATLTVAIGAGLPVAGTGLYAVDPYCTARTLTTPLLLFALSFVLRHRCLAGILCWSAAASLHPLMALWGALPLLLIVIGRTCHPRRWMLTLTLAIFLAAALLTATASPETSATYAVAHTRAYWFPAQWRWYEWLGAAAPCLLLAFAARSHASTSEGLRAFTAAVATTTVLATALATCFAHESATSLTIARLQPMRSLHLLFLAFLIVGGAALQRSLRSAAHVAAAFAALAVAAVSLFTMQRSLFAHTPHLEWPGSPPVNPWEAAFIWCRRNTPPEALFALDANYINQPAEDSHGFRAIALRSALPDGVKDAGIASVLPALTPSWTTGVAATTRLDSISDTERRNRLLSLGVTWLVLPASANTAEPCPYRNVAAKVCMLQSAAVAP